MQIHNIISNTLEELYSDFFITTDIPDGIQTETVANEWEFLRNFMTLNEQERILIGHDFKSFIKGCTFRGNDCGKEE